MKKAAKTIGFRADPRLVRLLEEEAERRRVKVSWLIRITLLDALNPEGAHRAKT